MRQNNKGLTLVELLVSVAVLSIVTLGIGGLLRLAAVQYSNASRETEVQNLIQTTVASIKNSIVDAKEVVFNNSDKELTLINDTGYAKYKKIGDCIYYADGVFSEGISESERKNIALNAAVSTAQENLLSDHVAKFFVDTNSIALGMVELQVEIRYMERTKYLAQNVFVRNLKPDSSVASAGGTTGGGTTGGGTTGGGTTGGGTTGGGTTGGGTTGGGTTGGGTTGGGTTGGGTTGGGTNVGGYINSISQTGLQVVANESNKEIKKITINFTEDFQGTPICYQGYTVNKINNRTIEITPPSWGMYWGADIAGIVIDPNKTKITTTIEYK